MALRLHAISLPTWTRLPLIVLMGRCPIETRCPLELGELADGRGFRGRYYLLTWAFHALGARVRAPRCACFGVVSLRPILVRVSDRRVPGCC